MTKRIIHARIHKIQRPELSSQLSKIFATTVDKVSYLTKKADLDGSGWRCIIEYVVKDDNSSETEIAYLDFAGPNGEGHNCAVAKLQTLKNHPEYFATGSIPEELLAESEKKWLGGISIPFSCIIFGRNDDTAVCDTGFLRVAFSGAQETTDAFVAIYAARVFRDALAEQFPEECCTFDLDVLKHTETGRIAQLFIG